MRNVVCCMLLLGFGFGCNDEKPVLQGFRFNKNWQMSVEAGAAMVDLFTDSSGVTYAVSNYGILFSRTGNQNWKREHIDAGYAKFTSINGYGNDVYVVGSHSAIFHKKGQGAWERIRIDSTGFHLRAVHPFKNDLWVMEDHKGIILHRDSSGIWKKTLSAGGKPIHALYGYGQELWALSQNAVYRKKPGRDWSVTLSTDGAVDFHTMYKNEHLAWVMGTRGNIYFNAGDEKWIKENADNIQDDITCSYGKLNDVYAAGKNGLILHRLPGGFWVKEKNIYKDIIANCITGRGGDIWIAANDGFIIHKKGNGPWTKVAGPKRNVDLHDMSSRGDTVFAVGNYATIMTKAGDGPWQRTPALMPDTPLTGIFKYGTDIIVSGNNGTLFHRLQNGQWQLEKIPANDAIFSSLYETNENIYLAGSLGTIAWRKKSDTAWSGEKISEFALGKIYGYKNKIWVFGAHSALMYKTENDSKWQEINIGVSEVDFIDVYGWKDQIWALGIKNKLGIIFHKDDQDNWSVDEIPESTDHYHAIYGREDTVWAVGSAGYFGLKYMSTDNYQGMIISKEGKKSWENQIDYLKGGHFIAINGIGYDTYAIGSAGLVYHKRGTNDWRKLETFSRQDELDKITFFKGIVMTSDRGIVYKEDDQRNFISIGRTDRISGFVPLGEHLFCVGRDAIFKLSPAEEKYAVIYDVSYRLQPYINPTAIDLQFRLQRPVNSSDSNYYGIYIYARPYNEGYDAHNWVQVGGGGINLNFDEHGISEHIGPVRIEVEKSLRVIPGMESANKICIRVDVSSQDGRPRESFELIDDNGNKYFTITNDLWLKYKSWIIAAAVLAAYYMFWVFLWGFYPLAFLRIYNSEKLQQLLLLKPPFHFLIGVVNVLLPLRKLADTPRVQNAWIRNFTPIAHSKFEKSEVAGLRKNYVPLPVKIDPAVTGAYIEKPDISLLQQLFEKDRTVVQIIGAGGAGKTSLAIAIGRWIIQAAKSKKSKQAPRLPILLETDNTDLLKEITRMIRSWQNDYAIHEDFVKMLLKNQRLVVIADSLSEKTVAIQDYFKTIHGEIPLNALIITARQPIDLQVKEGSFLFPTPLASNNLLYFIITYLNFSPDHPLQESSEQLAFAKNIVSIIEGNNNKVPITPILVKLIIEIAFKTEGTAKKDFETILKEMPESIPDVYYKYLALVNPTNSTAENYLPKHSMWKIVELLGWLSLQEKFIPQEFPEETARKAIAQEFDNISGDPIQRLIKNGIITRKESLARSYLSFNIDPLAEYLAASRLYDLHSKNPQELETFIYQVRSLDDEAREFKMAFSQVCDYKSKHG